MAKMIKRTKKLYRGMQERFALKPGDSTFYSPKVTPRTPSSDLESSTSSSAPGSPENDMLRSYDSGIESDASLLRHRQQRSRDSQKISPASSIDSNDGEKENGEPEDDIHYLDVESTLVPVTQNDDDETSCDESENENSLEESSGSEIKRSCTISTQTDGVGCRSTWMVADDLDLDLEPVKIDEEESDKLSDQNMRRERSRSHKKVSRQRSEDRRAVITGLEIKTDEVEEEGNVYYMHRVTDVEEDGIGSQLGIQINDCITRLNGVDVLQLTNDQLKDELSFNAAMFDLVLARKDEESECGIKQQSLCFTILKKYNQRQSSDRVSWTPRYEIEFHESIHCDLEEDGPDECRIIAKYLKSLGEKTYILKNGTKCLRTNGHVVELADYQKSDRSLYFCMRNFRGKNMQKLVRLYGTVSPATLKSKVLFGGDDGSTSFKNYSEVDGKIRTPNLCADDAIFEITELFGDKCVFESTAKRGHYLCVQNGVCSFQLIQNPESESKAHFSRMLVKDFPNRRKFRV